MCECSGAMKCLVQQLALQARHTFLPLLRGSSPQQLDKLISVANKIRAKDVDFNPNWVSNTDLYSPAERNAPAMHVFLHEDEVFSLGIFILRNGFALPLHDHPGMYGICKVVHGKVAITSYSLADTTRPVPESLRNLPVIPTHGSRIELNDESCCCLTPTEGNYHEIRAIDGPAAFLDILAPPYGDEIDCHYYKEVLREGELAWLQMVPQPREYWCRYGQYTGPSIDL